MYAHARIWKRLCMDWITLVIWIVSGLIGGIIAGGVVQILYSLIHAYALDYRLRSLENKIKSDKAVPAKQEKNLRRQAALAEAMPILMSGDINKLKEIAAKYPDILQEYMEGKL